MEVEDGYWRVDVESDSILQCLVVDACVGSSSDSYGDNLCRKGHEGPYCSVCIDNYFKEYNGLCEFCSAKLLQNSYILVTVLTVLGLLGIYAISKYTLKVANKQADTNERPTFISGSVFDDFEKRTLRFSEHVVSSVRNLQKRVSSRRITSLNFSDGNLSPINPSPSPIHLPQYEEEEEDEGSGYNTNQMIIVKIKIAFVFFQVILLFQEVYLIEYPDVYLNFLNFFSFFELDLFSVAKMDCVITGKFLSKLLFSTILPIVVSLLLYVGWIISRTKFGNDSKQFKIIENTLINLFIILTYVLYPSLCATIFSSFVCEDFEDGSSYLRADYSVDCDSGKYFKIYSLAIFMIFVYPIGIPLMYFLWLNKNREKLDPQRSLEEMSLGQAVLKRERDVNHLKFLYDAFLPKYYWTEVMECLRKLLLTGFVVFFYEGSALQIYFSLMISAFSFLLYVYFKPYLMPSNNTFAIFVHFQVFFTLTCSAMLLIHSHTKQDSTAALKFSSYSLGVALLTSNITVLVLGFLLILYSCINSGEGDFLDVGFDEPRGISLWSRPTTVRLDDLIEINPRDFLQTLDNLTEHENEDTEMTEKKDFEEIEIEMIEKSVIDEEVEKEGKNEEDL